MILINKYNFANTVLRFDMQCNFMLDVSSKLVVIVGDVNGTL